jgi:deferrochelatase/peroxidase EfeB
MPYAASSKLIKELVPGCEVKLYEQAAHGLYWTHRERVLGDLLGFVDGVLGKEA